MFDDLPDLLTIKQCQKALQIGRNSTLELLNSGTLKGFKLKGKWRIKKKELLSFVERYC